MLILLTLLLSPVVYANDTAKYTGKIKSLYSHERDSSPYFGIELEGLMDNNPCGSSKKYFIQTPDKVSQRHLSMLMAAHMAGRSVEISNSGATSAQRCFKQYPTFNLVKILN